MRKTACVVSFYRRRNIKVKKKERNTATALYECEYIVKVLPEMTVSESLTVFGHFPRKWHFTRIFYDMTDFN